MVPFKPLSRRLSAEKLEITVYTVVSALVYTGAVSWHLISRYINKNFNEKSLIKGLKDIVVNRTRHSINGRSLENMLTVPLRYVYTG